MADRRISSLSAITTVNDNDLMHLVVEGVDHQIPFSLFRSSVGALSQSVIDQIATNKTTAYNAYLDMNKTYLGEFSTNPVLDNEGDPVAEGAVYYNTTFGELRIYNGSKWPSINSLILITNDVFSGDGSNTVFTLSVSNMMDNLIVTVDGLQIDSTQYSLTGSTLVLASAPSSGTDNVVVRALATVTPLQDSRGVPYDPVGTTLVSTNAEAAVKEISTKIDSTNTGSGVPTGGVTYWPESVAVPEGYVECDGGLVTSVSQPDLYPLLQSGGYVNCKPYKDQMNFNDFDLSTISWQSSSANLSDVGTFYVSALVYVVNNRVYLIRGAIDAGTLSNKIYYRDIDVNGDVGTSWILSPNVLPTVLGNTTICYTEDYIYLIGGSITTGVENPYTTNVYRASINTPDVFTVLATHLPSMRSLSTVVLLGNRIYCIGGASSASTQAASNVWWADINDPNLSTWNVEPNIPFTTSYVQAVVVHNKWIYLQNTVTGQTTWNLYRAPITSTNSFGTFTLYKSSNVGGWIGQEHAVLNTSKGILSGNVYLQILPNGDLSDRQVLTTGVSNVKGVFVVNGKVYNCGGNQECVMTGGYRDYSDDSFLGYVNTKILPYLEAPIGSKAIIKT